MNPVITVVIPTYRRIELLHTCLLALARQQMPDWAIMEVIVVDDANDLAVADLTYTIGKQTNLRIRYFGQPARRGPAAARNRGWKAASSPYVAFTDDDCLPQPDWLMAGLLPLTQGAQVLTGRVKMPLSDQPTHHERTAALLETAEFVTANLFCRRAALAQVGGFDEQFDSAWREDSDLQFTLLEAGISVTSCPEAVIVHPLRSAPWYASLRDERKNRYDAFLYKRHPLLFRQRIPAYRKLVIRYYGAALGLLIGLGSLAAGFAGTALIGVGLWLFLTLRLISERLPKRLPTGKVLWQTILTSLATPFLSIYWRLYGAFKYNTWYW